MNTNEKTQENRLRRSARRQGLRLVKSRRRDPRCIDYGTYMLIDDRNIVVAWDMSIDAVIEGLKPE